LGGAGDLNYTSLGGEENLPQVANLREVTDGKNFGKDSLSQAGVEIQQGLQSINGMRQ
jgi:hypothetical protein